VSGGLSFDKGRLVSAREHFDAAIDMLLRLPEGARGEERAQAAFERLLDRIAAFDLLALAKRMESRRRVRSRRR
jgi:hypothetical protein